jgi:hypothetical protein
MLVSRYRLHIGIVNRRGYNSPVCFSKPETLTGRKVAWNHVSEAMPGGSAVCKDARRELRCHGKSKAMEEL